MCCWFPHLLSLPRSPTPPLSIFRLQRGLLLVSWSLSSQEQTQAATRARARALVVVPSATKENIGQREAVSALTTPQQRLHEREILIHKAASALRTPQERLHERELLIHQLSSAINKLLHNSVCLHERELLLIHKSSSAINSTRASKPAHMLEG
jgi:hypothetical protein